VAAEAKRRGRGEGAAPAAALRRAGRLLGLPEHGGRGERRADRPVLDKLSEESFLWLYRIVLTGLALHLVWAAS